MAGPAQSGVLIYAMYLELVSRFYEQVLPAAVLLADSEHRVRELASRVTRAVGVDAIPALIDQARRAGGGEFIVTPYEAILHGSVNGQFDVAVCNFSLFGQEVVQSLFAAVPSLLRPGGHFVVQTLHPLVANGESAYVDGWPDGSWAGFCGDFVDPPPWYFRTVDSWIAFFSAYGFGLR